MKRSINEIVLKREGDYDYRFLSGDSEYPIDIAEDIRYYIMVDDYSGENDTIITINQDEIVRWVSEYINDTEPDDLFVATGNLYNYVLSYTPNGVHQIILECGDKRDYDFLLHSTPNSIAEEIEDFLINDDDNYVNVLDIKVKKRDIVKWVEDFIDGNSVSNLLVAVGKNYNYILKGID